MTEKYNYCDFEMMAACRAVEALAQPEPEPVAHVYFLDEPSGRPRVAWDNANGIKIGDKLYTTPPQRKPLTNEQERKEFEQWYVENVFNFKANPIGSRQCGLQWSAWKARAAHGIKE